MKRFFYSFLFVLFSFSLIISSINCHKEVAKDKTDKVLAEPSKIPPGHAEITGEIVEIEPISKMEKEDSPCSKAPCIAKVKIDGVTYGSGFPVLSKKKEIMIKFNFTLMPTTKELFPNMDDSYPGLNVGDKFEALVAYSETGVVGSENASSTSYKIYGYKLINK